MADAYKGVGGSYDGPLATPVIDGNYVYGDPASAPGWIFDVIYEFEFDMSFDDAVNL